MDRLDQNNADEVEIAQLFFDRYIIAQNPHETSHRNNTLYQGLLDDPCLLNTYDILSTNNDHDYEELINRVQHHTRCRQGTYLQKKRHKIRVSLQRTMEKKIYFNSNM